MPRNFLGCTFTPSITLGMWAPAVENRALGVATVKVSVCRRTLPQVKVLRLYGATIKVTVLRVLLSTLPLVRGTYFHCWLLHLLLPFSTLLFFFVLFVPHCAVIKSQNDRWFYLCRLRHCRNAFEWNRRKHTCMQARTHIALLSTTDIRARNYICHPLEATTALIICDEI